MATETEMNLLRAYCVGKGLNIGCGSRPFSNALNIDTDPNANADLFADASLLPLYSERFDFVVSAHCLEHVREAPLVVFREWLRVLKVGGVMAFIVPDAADGLVSMGSTPGEFVRDRHVHVFTVQTLRILLQYAGVKILKIQPIDRKEWKTKTILAVAVKVKPTSDEVSPGTLRAYYSWFKQAVKTRRF